ncbi:MAG: signal peptide peptidase SppA [Mariprofundus sp.]
MKIFFSGLLRWLDRLRRLLINGLFVLVILAVVFALFSSQADVPEQAALVIDPHGQIVEELELPSPMALPLGGDIATSQTRLHDMTAAINRATTDERIHLLILKLDEMGSASLPLLQELRKSIESFRASGKKVIATGPNYTQSQYYLAATANTVFLQPMGFIGIEGFSIYRNYIRDALDSLHIHAEVFRAGKYKSAIEPLLRNDMSVDDRQANKALLTTLWDSYLNNIAAMRKLDPAHLQAVLDSPASYLEKQHGNLAELAISERLVDKLADQGAIEDDIAEMMGSENGDYASISFRDYLHAAVNEDEAYANRIGIITASGMILDGEQPAGSIGSSTMLAMLKQAQQDDAIKAVVLRIDSPGGSAQASDIIRTAIIRLQKAGKPVVVSMGGVAASGGYWIAAPADEIWAAPTTITGSIGAFGVMLNMQQGLEELGIHSDGVGTTSIAGGMRIDRAMPEELSRVMQLTIDNVYQRFVHIVATGRGLDETHVAEIAQGRVWSGQDAKRLGLVDQLGGFDDAVKAAARLASLGDYYDLHWIKPPQGFSEIILARLMGKADTLFPGVWQSSAYLLAATTGATNSAALSPLALRQYAAWLGIPLHQPGALALSNLRVK